MSYSYSGSNDNLSCIALTVPVTGSAAGWFKPTNATGDSVQHNLWDSWDGASSSVFTAVKYSDNNLYIGWKTSGTDYRCIATSGNFTFNQNAWNHVCLTWDDSANVTKLYINGTHLGSFDTSTLVTYNTATLDQFNLGNVGAGGAHWAGKISKFGIWHVVLSGSEVTTLAGAADPTTVQNGAIDYYWSFLTNATGDIGGKNLTVSGATHDTDEPAASGGVVITTPVTYQTIQQSAGGTATISITGTYTGSPVHLEANASWTGSSYTTIVSSPSAGSYSGSLTGIAAGQGTLTVRWSDDHSKSATVPYLGIGDVFGCFGASNMNGQGTSSQSYYGFGLKATKSVDGTTFAEQADPTDSNGGTGSWLTPMSTHILANRRYPSCFLMSTVNGSTSADWQSGQSAYTNAAAIVAAAGGIKAVLFWIGGGDALAGTSEGTIEAALNAMVNSFFADFGCLTFLPVSEQITGQDITAYRAAVVAVLASNPHARSMGDMSDITPDDGGYHFQSTAKMQTVASRVWNSLDNVLYNPTGGGGFSLTGGMNGGING